MICAKTEHLKAIRFATDFHLSKTHCSHEIFAPTTMAPIHPEQQLDDFVVDENGQLDFSDLERQYAVPREEGFDQVIVVDNCPIVEDGARKDKLVAFIRKIFSTNGVIKPDGIFMPMIRNEETGKMQSQGYVLL